MFRQKKIHLLTNYSFICLSSFHSIAIHSINILFLNFNILGVKPRYCQKYSKKVITPFAFSHSQLLIHHILILLTTCVCFSIIKNLWVETPWVSFHWDYYVIDNQIIPSFVSGTLLKLAPKPLWHDWTLLCFLPLWFAFSVISHKWNHGVGTLSFLASV